MGFILPGAVAAGEPGFKRDLRVRCLRLLTNVILSALTGQTSAFMENYEVFDDAVLVGVCGYIPADFVDGPIKIRAANLGETNRGISNVSKVKTGKVTFARLYVKDGAFRMFLSRAEATPNPKWTELAGGADAGFPKPLAQAGDSRTGLPRERPWTAHYYGLRRLAR